ncbi:MAG: YfhO family protein [Halioglobus sp.]
MTIDNINATRNPSRKEYAIAALFFLASTYLIWSVLEPWTRIEIWANFDNRNYHPDMIAYGMNRLLHGEWPFWNPFQAGGVPFFAALQGMVLYPTTWLALFLSAETTHVVSKYLHLAMSGFSIFFYLRVLKLHPIAAFLGGLFYMTGNFYLVFTVFETGTYPLATIGILLGAAEKIFQTTSKATDSVANRWSLIFMVTLTFQVFAGYIQSVVFIGYFLCLYIMFRIGQLYVKNRSGRVAIETFVRFTFMAILSVMLSAIQILPTYEMSSHSATHNLLEGMDLSYVNIAFLPPLSLLEALSDPVVPIPQSPWDMAFWLLVACGLLLSRKYRSFAIFFLLATYLFLTLARGSDNWLYSFYFHYVPTGNWFRWPEKFLSMSNLTLSILVAIGLHGCHQLLSQRRWSSLKIAFWLYCFGIFGVAFLSRYSTADVQVEHPDWHWKAFGKDYAPYQLSTIRRDMIHLAQNPAQFTIHQQNPYSNADGALNFLRRASHNERVVSLLIVDWDYVPDLPVKWGMREHLYSIEDYEPLNSSQYDNFVKKMRPSPFFHRGLPSDKRMMSLFSTKWLLVSQHWINRHPGRLPKNLNRVYSDAYFQVFLLPNFIPRSYISDTVVSMPEDEILSYLSESSFDPATQVVVDEALPIPHPESGNPILKAEIVQYEPEKVAIKLPTLHGQSILVLTDSYDPNWRARIDGKPARIFPVNSIFRGIEVNEGDREVVFTYHPVYFYFGAAITASAVLLITLLHFIFRVKRRIHGPATHILRQHANISTSKKTQ